MRLMGTTEDPADSVGQLIGAEQPIALEFVCEANLSGADLRLANLSDAEGVTQQQVAQAKSLKGATMPNGQKYKNWLKSRGGEDG